MEGWIIRDNNGDLWFSPNEPEGNEAFYSLDNKLFPNITFNNSPKQIKIELI